MGYPRDHLLRFDAACVLLKDCLPLAALLFILSQTQQGKAPVTVQLSATRSSNSNSNSSSSSSSSLMGSNNSSGSSRSLNSHPYLQINNDVD